MKSGVSAWTYSVYSTALKSLKGTTIQDEKYKSTYDNQILEIDNVYKDRNIEFRLSHKDSEDDDYVDSTWQGVGSPYPKLLQIHGGLFTSQVYIATTPGIKKLSMRTSGIHIGVTGLYGVWWLSEDEYYIAN